MPVGAGGSGETRASLNGVLSLWSQTASSSRVHRVLERAKEECVEAVHVLVERIHHGARNRGTAVELAQLRERLHGRQHLHTHVEEAGGGGEERERLGMKQFMDKIKLSESHRKKEKSYWKKHEIRLSLL